MLEHRTLRRLRSHYVVRSHPTVALGPTLEATPQGTVYAPATLLTKLKTLALMDALLRPSAAAMLPLPLPLSFLGLGEDARALESDFGFAAVLLVVVVAAPPPRSCERRTDEPRAVPVKALDRGDDFPGPRSAVLWHPTIVGGPKTMPPPLLAGSDEAVRRRQGPPLWRSPYAKDAR